jgi:hypothetical protein
MFFIDYSLPWYSRYILFLDAPFRYSSRHLVLFFHNKSIHKHTRVSVLSYAESIAHFCIAFFEVIPILGLLVALIDWLLFKRPLREIVLESKNPFEAGKALVKACSDELQFIMHKILPIYKSIMVFRGKNPYEEAKKLERYIPERFIEEMKGIAKASGIAYDEILVANTIIDSLELFGCSICAMSKERSSGKVCREYATNYFHSRGRGHTVIDVDRSFWRYDEMEAFNPDFDKRSLQEMLRRVNYRDTINTIIFDVNRREIQLAIGSDYTANRRLCRFKAKKLFGDTLQIDGPFNALLARNLDWPMAIFAPLTRVFVRRGHEHLATASIAWAGIIGAYSGMNEKGLSLAASIVPSSTQEGIPCQLLFRKILEEAKSVQDALKIIDKSRPSSAMNLMIAAADGIVHAELDPARKSIGASSVTFGK